MDIITIILIIEVLTILVMAKNGGRRVIYNTGMVIVQLCVIAILLIVSFRADNVGFALLVSVGVFVVVNFVTVCMIGYLDRDNPKAKRPSLFI